MSNARQYVFIHWYDTGEIIEAGTVHRRRFQGTPDIDMHTNPTEFCRDAEKLNIKQLNAMFHRKPEA